MMYGHKKVLIPLDGSPESEAALGAVMPLVRTLTPEVALLRVAKDEEIEAAKNYLERASAALGQAGLKVTWAIRVGSPSEKILDYAAAYEPDLIAMVTHGRGGLARVFQGSVTEDVIRHSDVPVLALRPGGATPSWKRVLVPLDGSENAEEILPWAMSLARKLGALVFLLQVVEVIPVGEVGEMPLYVEPKEVKPYLRGICDRFCAVGVPAHPLVRFGDPAGEIIRQAREADIGLICMATHGRTGVSRFFVGSVTERVLRRAPCSVLTRRTLAAPVVLAE